MSLSKWLRILRSQRPSEPATFILVYMPTQDTRVQVGQLDFDGKEWTFEYHDEYKRRPDLRAIEGFDDREKVYRSEMLFPFFSVRIPDPKRTDVRRLLDADHISQPQASDMLRLFGRRVASSPGFELQPA